MTFEDVDPTVLQTIPHRGGPIELNHKAPEVTFLGVRNQPDFGELFITMYPDRDLIELKSLKEYLYSWRDVVVSYERFVDVVFDHMMQIYNPVRLRLVFVTRPRGGISSKIVVDSDWKVRGGREEFRDWVGQEDEW
jgi:7-cyano-7-deazaguanine reductase